MYLWKKQPRKMTPFRWIKISFPFICIFLISFTHKFYVSTVQLDYINDKKLFRLTVRIFIDDIEKVLKIKHEKNIYLTDKEEITEANQYLKDYINDKLKIKINNQELQLNFLGKESEDNVLICYLNAPFPKKPKNIEVSNIILTEAFSEQQNLVHLKINSLKETLLFNQSKTTNKLIVQ